MNRADGFYGMGCSTEVQLCWVLTLTAVYRSGRPLIAFKCQVLREGAQKQHREELIGTGTGSFSRSLPYIRLRSVCQNVAQTQLSFVITECPSKSKCSCQLSGH